PCSPAKRAWLGLFESFGSHPTHCSAQPELKILFSSTKLARTGVSRHRVLLKLRFPFFARQKRSRARVLRSAYAEPPLGRRTTLTFPLLSPPQKNRSPPSDSSPDTVIPGGISSLCRTSPVCGSMRRKSLSPPSRVACQSSPSTQVTPVTKRLDSMVRRTAPVLG